MLQIFGGLTLVAAYGLGEPGLFAGAPTILIALGVLQMVVGTSWLMRTRALRDWVVRWPGTFVALTLACSSSVMVLGSSNSDVVFVTSAMAWLITTGFVLLGYRWLLVGVLQTAGVSAVWILVEGDAGGYAGDGNYGTAIVGLAAAVVPGLWLGRVTGQAFVTLNRWHVVELHERGLIGRVRQALQRVDQAAATVAGHLPDVGASPELSALRARLALGAVVRDDEETRTIAAVAAAITEEYGRASLPAALQITIDPAIHDLELGPTVADTLSEVIRRQLLNVARHAPNATLATVTLDLDPGAAMLRARVEDDGAGELSFRAGVGTQWSGQQLGRVGGTARYYAGEHGIGFEARVPAAATATISDVPELSVTQAIDRFAAGMLTALRFAGYSVDSLAAFVARDDLGALWLLMPIASMLIELVIQVGVPGLARTRESRLLVASLLITGVAAAYAIPSSSPLTFIPATSSVVIVAHLIYVRRARWWLAVELLRLLVVLPLLLRADATAIEVLLIYPAGFSYLVFAILRFGDRAVSLEESAAHAMGRAALSGAAVRGIALHHDAVEVIVRAGASAPGLRDAVADLERALHDLAAVSSDTLDPREAMLTGVQASVSDPVSMASASAAATRADLPMLMGAVDRVGLIELAALAADERATCASPGVFGRRRLRTFTMSWAAAASRGAEVTLAAEPTLGPPDPRAVDRLRAVAATLGVVVVSTPQSLTLTFNQT